MSTSSKARSIIVFVEGTANDAGAGAADQVSALWGNELPQLLRCRRPSRVVGFSKGSLEAMRLPAGMKRTSATGLPLDKLMEMNAPFDAALVVWDAIPPWDRTRPPCRAAEVRSFYEAMAGSTNMTPVLRAAAGQRRQALEERHADPPCLARESIAALCLDPEFETVLADSSTMKSALGFAGRPLQQWPRDWKRTRPKDVIANAVGAALNARPKPSLLRARRMPFESDPNGWARWLVGRPAFQTHLGKHPLMQRYAALLGPP